MFRIFDENKRIFFISGALVCLVIIILSFTPVPVFSFISNGLVRAVSPLQRGASNFADWVSSLSNSGELAKKNRLLMLENESLRLENIRLSMQVEEIEMLYSLLTMQSRYMNLSSVGVRIIGWDPNVTTSRFFIDKGYENGIFENMAVFAGGGLAGVVRQSSHGRSVVVSVLDSSFAAAGMCKRTGEFGVVRGELSLAGNNLLRMDHINVETEIVPGDEIVTSFYSYVFPQGLRIGTVMNIYRTRDGLSKYAFISPFVNINEIEAALVITGNSVYD